MTKKRCFYLFMIVILLLGMTKIPDVQAATITYTVKADMLPYKNLHINKKTYNSKTKQYYMLRSYLERLEQVGGGKLILSKGTYVLTNTLYVPSNVTIVLKDGVKLIKGMSTGTLELKPSKSMFQLAAPSKSKVEGAYQGYLGECNIQFLGEGSATIDMNYVKDSIGIIFGHNSDVVIRGITFQNMYSGHFIELDASRGITIENNKFHDHKASASGIKEAINIDTPDRKTEGYHTIWTNYDCTPNLNVVISKNTFRNLERAIGTHKYTENQYHENIQIIDNEITNIDSDAIRIQNWKTPTITGNVITRAGRATPSGRGILASGTIHPVFQNNTFIEIPRPIQLMPWRNTDAGSDYAITYNVIDQNDIAMMLQNYLSQVGESFIRVNNTYNEFAKDTQKYYYTSEYIR